MIDTLKEPLLGTYKESMERRKEGVEEEEALDLDDLAMIEKGELDLRMIMREEEIILSSIILSRRDL